MDHDLRLLFSQLVKLINVHCPYNFPRHDSFIKFKDTCLNFESLFFFFFYFPFLLNIFFFNFIPD